MEQLSDFVKSELIESLQDKLREIEVSISKVEDQLLTLKTKKGALLEAMTFVTSNSVGRTSANRNEHNFKKDAYDLNWSWTDKVAFALRALGKPSTIHEIRDFLFQLEGKDPENEAIIRKVSKRIYFLKKQHQILENVDQLSKLTRYSLKE